jgi:hypothetical protein
LPIYVGGSPHRFNDSHCNAIDLAIIRQRQQKARPDKAKTG